MEAVTKKRVLRISQLAVFTMVAASPLVFAAGEVEQGITDVSGKVTTYIGLAIAAAFGLLTLSLAPDIGLTLVKKWIKKGAK